jgi:hypothetical protein
MKTVLTVLATLVFSWLAISFLWSGDATASAQAGDLAGISAVDSNAQNAGGSQESSAATSSPARGKGYGRGWRGGRGQDSDSGAAKCGMGGNGWRGGRGPGAGCGMGGGSGMGSGMGFIDANGDGVCDRRQ